MRSAGEQLLRISLCCLVVTGVALCAKNTAFAQIPSPGYIFVEVRDESDKPIANATGVVYDMLGAEIGSGVTDERGEAALIRNRAGESEWVFRIIKSGYLVYEGVMKTTGEYSNTRVPVKLVRRVSSKPIKPKETSPPAKIRARPRGFRLRSALW